MNGPSLLRAPDWVETPLGADYLYFADQKGDRIELAYADRLEGPWEIHEPGAIHLRDTPFLQSPPEIPVEIDRASLAAARGIGVPSILDDVTIPHIASPKSSPTMSPNEFFSRRSTCEVPGKTGRTSEKRKSAGRSRVGRGRTSLSLPPCEAPSTTRSISSEIRISSKIQIVTDICSMRRPGNLGSRSLGSGSQTKPEPEY